MTTPLHPFVILSALVGMALSASAAEPQPVKTVRNFGAAGDGVADDTAAIQSAVDASAGDLLFPRGVYRISRPVVIDLDKAGPASVVGTGAAKIVMAGPGPAIRFVGTHEGTAAPASVKPTVWERQRMPMVEGLVIVGDHPDACGIEAIGTMKLTVTRVTVRGVLHAIRLAVRNRNVIVSDCHLYENRGVGLFLDDVDLHQINVTGSHISYNAQGGIVVRAGSVRNLHVSGCDIEGNAQNILLDSAGSATGVAEVAITGCTLQHPGGEDSANIRFIGADPEGARTWGFLTITGNVFTDTETNIDIRKARTVSITGNTVGTGYRHSLRIEDSSNITIGPNTFDRHPRYRDEQTADNALWLGKCDDVTISGLHVNGVRRTEGGLVLEDCRRVNLTGCTILDCDNAGLVFKAVSDSRVSDCLIRNDIAGDAAWRSIKLAGGRGNMVVDNLLGGPAEIDAPAAKAVGNVFPESRGAKDE
ncbi:MAG: right-handed parallel beta-helix repeat-containing protein [Pirellulales bacterium]|nr:right-handed parallel beta-helix repeat-containing protein [Pirellulales bacterium]